MIIAEDSATESDSESELLTNGITMTLSTADNSKHWYIILSCQGNTQENSETESDSDSEVLADKVLIHVDS